MSDDQSPLKLDVAKGIQRRLQHHHRWWKKNRKDAPTKFGEALLAAYAELETSRGSVGVSYVTDDGLRLRRVIMATQHMLFYAVVGDPPQRPYVLVVGVQGPGEAEPFLSV